MLDYQSYNTRKRNVDINNAALLVIDMQNFFNDITPKIINNVNLLIDKFHSHHRPVIFTQYFDDDPNVTMLSEWWPNDHVIKDSADYGLVPELHMAQEDLIVPKPTYDSFHNTSLEVYLKQHKIKDLVITGLLTNCCCETTARAAFVKDYRVHVVPDANTAYEDALHNAALSNLAYAFAYLPSTAELLKLKP